MPRKDTIEEVKTKFHNRWGYDLYDYSLFTEYKGSKKKIPIICKRCGKTFEKTPHQHLILQQGCKYCDNNGQSKKRIRTQESFQKEASLLHNSKYDYSKAKYKDTKTKVCIICPKHGEFLQTPKDHLAGHGCPKCNGGIKLTQDEFIHKSQLLHKNKYDYSKVEYVNISTKVRIICPKHGEFLQTPSTHLKGCGCQVCAGVLQKDNQAFISESKGRHNEQYDYSNTNYINKRTKVCIICPEHGEFWQLPGHHLSGCGCPKCNPSNKRNIEDFVKEAREIHGGKYDYSLSNYKNDKRKLTIICPVHGEFLQTPREHLAGCGCKRCTSSHLENEIRSYLERKGIEFVEQYSPQWLTPKSLDFYLPQYSVGIECQGEQHFRPIKFFGGQETLKTTQQRDQNKLKKCQENGIKLLYYSNLSIPFPYKVYTDKDNLLEEIKNG